MDFLRLSRSRSGSSGNKKSRSPLPSPPRGQLSAAADDQDHGPSSGGGPSHAGHASDQAQRARKGSSTSNNSSNMSSIAALIRSTSVATDLDDAGRSPAEPHHGSLSQAPLECTFPSLLSPPNPAFVSGSEARGILINARRPSLQDGMVQTRSAFATTIPAKRSSNTPAATLAPRPPHLRSSVSSDSILKTTTAASTSTSATATDERGRGRIRFAPLPDPRRPRSYSTGRDIWFDDDAENHVHINTRDGSDVTPGSWSSSGSGKVGLGSTNGSSAQSNSLAMSLGDGLNDDYSLSPGNESKQASHKRTSSTLSKLLQPLKLGRSKSRESDKPNSPDSDSNRLSLSLSTSPSTSLSHWMNGGEPLSRSISTGAGSADIEIRRKEEFKSSGVPLKKSSTQESQKQQPTRRILYPSVAQGGVRKRDIRTVKPVKEPEFVEWTNPSARTGMNGSQQDDDDDGTGMAWLKKRRAERERKAKEEAAAAAAAAAIAKSADVKSEESQKIEAKETTLDTSTDEEDASNTLDNGQAMPGIIVDNSETMASVNHDQPELDTQEDIASEDKSLDGSAVLHDVAQENDEEDDDSASDLDDEEEIQDDLSAAEIEEEDRLAEEARRTTGGASRELYHSHEHQASTYTFEAPPLQRRVSSRANSLNIPTNFDRTVSYSSLKSDMPRSMANSHPGDWPVLDQAVVPPC